jgi:hypothetical protein
VRCAGWLSHHTYVCFLNRHGRALRWCITMPQLQLRLVDFCSVLHESLATLHALTARSNHAYVSPQGYTAQRARACDTAGKNPAPGPAYRCAPCVASRVRWCHAKSASKIRRSDNSVHSPAEPVGDASMGVSMFRMSCSSHQLLGLGR